MAEHSDGGCGGGGGEWKKKRAGRGGGGTRTATIPTAGVRCVCALGGELQSLGR
jgi:hypothetical protein